jgi:hypothetical protein
LFSFIRKDEFTIESPSVGEINKILIGHDNKGLSAGWFLDRVVIEDLNLHRTYEFPCNRWLAKDEDDKQISRILIPKTSTGGQRQPTAAAAGGKKAFILEEGKNVLTNAQYAPLQLESILRVIDQ